ncbi:MAG: ATPase domain [Bacteroidota bacterium]
MPIKPYYIRFQQIKAKKNISSDSAQILNLIESDPAGLNNYFMAAFGMSTLMLRLGAVIQMCQKFERLEEAGDALFLKQILDNLRETLPSDTSWKNLWTLSAESEQWLAPTRKPKNAESLLNRFVTFRNRFVHQQIKIDATFVNQLTAAVALFDEMAELIGLFNQGEIILFEDKYYWQENGSKVCLYPYLQASGEGQDAYIFQGLYHNKTQAQLLNLRFGDEIEQNAHEHIEPNFEPIKDQLRGGAGQVFDHSERIAYYQSCFVGREREQAAVHQFCTSQDEQNVLCVKSPAGMGKGALIANVIEQLKSEKTQVLYHYCGAGIQNSLHATLYHFILQGLRNQYWLKTDEAIQRKLERLPSKYIDVIHFFQNLLNENLAVQKANTTGNLIIILDGLDEAQVAYPQLKISDWFYTYNEKEEPENDWRSNPNIRWVFTYRCSEDGSEPFFQFPKIKELAESPILQPLSGLSPEAVDEAFKEFKVSNEFRNAVVEKARILLTES